MAEQTQVCATIAATPPDIMAVIADVEAYPEWADAVREVEIVEAGAPTRSGLRGRRSTQPGPPAQVRFVLDAGVLRDEYVLAYDWSVPDCVSWHLVRAKVLRAMEGSYTLVPKPDGTTDVTYALTVSLRIPLLAALRRRAERVIVDTALAELGKRVLARRASGDVDAPRPEDLPDGPESFDGPGGPGGPGGSGGSGGPEGPDGAGQA